MANLAGFDIPVSMPSFNFSSFLSGSWIYVLLVVVIGFILILTIAMIMFFRMYNTKIEIYENVAGAGYQKTLVTRARKVKIDASGGQVLKTLVGGAYITAYGRKIGKNTYMFVKGPDGYLYNSIHGDFDTKLAMLDIEPIDRDIRMFHTGMAKINQANYQKLSFMEKHGNAVLAFIFLAVFILGMWFLLGKIGSATESLADTARINADVAETIKEEIVAYNNIKSGPTQSGIIPAIIGGG